MDFTLNIKPTYIFFLYSAQLSQVNDWLNFEINTEEKPTNNYWMKPVKVVFTESCVVAVIFLPTICSQRKMQILNSNKRLSSDGD